MEMGMEMLSSPVKKEESRYPFTSGQWQELEHQALVYKYMISGMPIPPHLLFSIKRSLDCSTQLILNNHSPLQSIGWKQCFEMGYGSRKIDPEPGRCRRTDGKKWRCSKDAHLDSKYCERHMHRGRNRSRKPVESSSSITTTTTTNYFHNNNNNNNNNNNSPFGYHPHQLSSRSTSSNGNYVMSSHHQDGFLLESSPYSRKQQHSYGMKEDVDEHPFLSNKSCGSGSVFASKQRSFSDYPNDYSYMQLQNTPTQQQQQKQDDQGRCYDHQLALKFERKGEEPQKVMHHFFDESPHNDNEDNNNDSSTTQLSISIPSFAHDFFLTHNDK